MDLETAIRERRSARQFTDEPVPEATIRGLLDTARWSPSWANTQSWSVFVVTGATLAKLKDGYRARLHDRAERRFDLPPHGRDWPPHLRGRTEQLMAARQAATGAPTTYPPPFPTDFFGAPCMALFAVDERLAREYSCFDVGLLVQTFCLAAHGKGLGTCIMAMAVAYSDVLHELLPEASDKRFVVGVALGVPDWSAPVNRFERQRAGLEEWVSWMM
jgi:nitroreductase